jgi:hypothetical protein
VGELRGQELLEAISKNGFWFPAKKARDLRQDQGGREVQTGGILVYFEDLN